TAMGEAARLVDELAHRHAGARWLATGGGGYDVYRVVPRTWTLTWLAGAHREAPATIDPGWRERWTAEAAAYGQDPPPSTFDDPPNAGLPDSEGQRLAEARALETIDRVRNLVLPRLLVVAQDRGWWDPLAPGPARGAQAPSTSSGGRSPTILAELTPEVVERLVLAPRTIAPFDPVVGRQILLAALRAGCRASGAVLGDALAGVALVLPSGDPDFLDELIALGVAPDYRRQGIATALLLSLAESDGPVVARPGVAERDVVDPLPLAARLAVADRLMSRPGIGRAR
ncbi:MAG TPA: GNAT family N-acetyltransferase, partial [Candidatus Limnocylindrales bacterium]